MTWNDIVRKLTSRKFWAALAAFVVALLIYTGVIPSNAEQVGALIMMGATVIVYIVGEGLVDAKRVEIGEALPLIEDEAED